MAHTDTGFVTLPAYAARASLRHRLVLDEVTQSNRSTIVHSAIGPYDVPIHLRGDGIAIFEFDLIPRFSGGVVSPYEVPDDGNIPPGARREIAARNEIRQARFVYMNAFLACFHTSANISNRLAPSLSEAHHIWARNEGGIWRLMDNGEGHINPLPFALTIPIDFLVLATNRFKALTGSELEFSLGLLDLFYKASFNLSNSDYQAVLTLCWAIVEGCLDRLWSKFVKFGYKRINPHSTIVGKRRKVLLEDHNYTASIRSQMLALSGEIHDSELALLDKVRKKRNGFMHSLKAVSQDDAYDAMAACGIVARRALGLELGTFGGAGGWDFKM